MCDSVGPFTEIKGQGAGGVGYRLFYVYTGAEVSLEKLELSGGYTSYGGGAVYIQRQAILKLKDCLLRDNHAGVGALKSGGAIVNFEGTLEMVNCMVTRNYATQQGGGIASKGQTTIKNCNISDNQAGQLAGGIINEQGTFSIVNSTVERNEAVDEVGGIYNHNGEMEIYSTTIAHNKALGAAVGGIYTNGGNMNMTECRVIGNVANDYAGGIYAEGSNLNMKECEISRNLANGVLHGGGGLYVWYSSITLESCTFQQNTALACGGAICNDNSQGTNSLIVLDSKTRLVDNTPAQACTGRVSQRLFASTQKLN